MDLRGIRWLVDRKDYQNAAKALSLYLADHPDEPMAKYLFGYVLSATDCPAGARLIFEGLAGEVPEQNRLTQLGACWDKLGELDRAAECYRGALDLDQDNIDLMNALAATIVTQHKNEETLALLKQVTDRYPTNKKAVHTAAFAYLNQRDYARGWDAFESGVGHMDHRKLKKYQEEPYWNGEAGNLVVYSEQGLGDQIVGVEPLRDCPNNVVLLDCNPKLVGLFRRSFPGIPVEGHWYPEKWTAAPVDYSCAMFSLHKQYRRSAEAYPGTPYLVADPVRRAGWRAILDTLGSKPKVGIAWSGGVAMTQKRERYLSREQLETLLTLPYTFIDLEYRQRDECAEYGIHSFPWATQTQDYDDTAALVAELDMVITVPTSVAHLAGALGVETHVLVDKWPGIHWGSAGDSLPYNSSVSLYRGENRVQALTDALRINEAA